jgi:hypothetical protein
MTPSVVQHAFALSTPAMTLACSTGGETIGMITFATLTECYAEDTAYLTSVAWCTHVKCQDVRPPADLLEYRWDMQITGQKTAGARAIPAKWTYGQALTEVTKPPTFQLNAQDTGLNATALVSPDVWQAQYNVLYSTQREGTLINKYGPVITYTCTTNREAANTTRNSNVSHRILPSSYHHLDGYRAVLWSTAR